LGAIGIDAGEARQLALRAQGLARAAAGGAGGVGGMLRRVAAVQLDTISVLARSHELVSYARLGGIGRARVEQAFWGHPARAFEYYAHANCVLPVELWPYLAFRRRGLRALRRRSVGERALREVRARLRDGPVTASDVGGARGGPGGWWNWSAEKNALETLYYRGEVVCAARRSWKRVYDLPERALPARVLRFSMRLEAYKPRAERVHGYFTMPLLADGRLVARVDPAREGTTLVVRSASLEDPSMLPELAAALRETASWVGCDSVRAARVRPASLAGALRRALSE
jgi:uncharacterized protein YcaQ